MNNITTPRYLAAQWPAPKHIQTITTLRHDKTHTPLQNRVDNFAIHVTSEQSLVHQNRKKLQHALNLNQPITWLNQQHTADCLCLDNTHNMHNPLADAAISTQRPCAVLTADCLPILITNKNGTQWAAIHAGWRGLLQDIISNTLVQFNYPSRELLVWLAPAIGATAYRVKQPLYDQFVQQNSNYHHAFIAISKQHYQLNLYDIARTILQQQRIPPQQIYGGNYCTFSEARFHSYRRDKTHSGRMATLIWSTKQHKH